MLHVLSLPLPAGLKMNSKLCHRLREPFHAFVLRGHRAHHRRMPAISRHHQRKHRDQLLLEAVGALAVRLVQNKYVANLHQPRLHVLYVVSQPGHEHHDHAVRQSHDIDFVLAHAHGFDEYLLLPGGIEQQRHFRGCSRQAAEKAAGRHRPNKHAAIPRVALHADAIAKNRPARIGARRIYRDYPNLLLLFPVISRKPVHKGALSRSRCARNARQIGLTCMRKKKPQQLFRFLLMIFNRRDRARHRPHIARAHLFRPCFNGQSHIFPVELLEKARRICPLFLAEELPGNHQLLNFAGAFADGAELHVAVIFLRGVILDEPVAAVNLHALVGHLDGDFACK